MATKISKEELLRAVKGTTGAVPAAEKMNWLSTLMQFINTPVTQEFLRRMMDRWMPAVKQQRGQIKTPPTTGKKAGAITGDKVFKLITSSLANVPDEMTVVQLREWLKQNKKEVVGSIDKALGAGLM